MIDRMLDRIAVLLLKVDDNDQYKESLEREYKLYREILESIPRSAQEPSKLMASVFSMEQRLNNYVLIGTKKNPLVQLAPMIVSTIHDEEEKSQIIDGVDTNPTYIANRKKRLAILTKYLDGINFDGDLKDIGATIKTVWDEYLLCNIYSNEFEQVVARAKYFYMVRLIYDGSYDEATKLLEEFDSDVILFMHGHLKDSIDILLDMGRATLADELYHFLNNSLISL